MNDYSTLGYQCKREIQIYSEKLGKGMKRPEKKLLCQMLFGLMESQNCQVTKIARALKERITLKKTVERISKGLAGFGEGSRLMENYVQAVKPTVGKNTLLVIDESDVTKPCSRALEGLCRVYDGSTGEIRDGYPVQLGVLSNIRERSKLMLGDEGNGKQGSRKRGGSEGSAKAIERAGDVGSVREHLGSLSPWGNGSNELL